MVIKPPRVSLAEAVLVTTLVALVWLQSWPVAIAFGLACLLYGSDRLGRSYARAELSAKATSKRVTELEEIVSKLDQRVIQIQNRPVSTLPTGLNRFGR